MEQKISKQHTEKTWTSFLYSVFGVTLPFILSLIGIIIIKKYEHITSFIDDGQVLLFSAGLLTSTYYLFRDDENQKTLKKFAKKTHRIVSHLSIIVLLITSVIYAILYSFNIIPVEVNINIWFIRISSVFIFIFSLYSSFLSIYIDFTKIYPIIDVKKSSTQEINELMDKL